MLALGKLPPKLDHRTFQLQRLILPAALPPVPLAIDYSAKVNPWPMYKNDQYGDCTIASVAHLTQLQAALDARVVTPTDADVIAMYSQVSGFDPRTGANDYGAVELDVLNLWRKQNFAGNSLFAFASVAPSNEVLVRSGIMLFGGLYIGLALPLSAQGQLSNKVVWDDTGDQPGTWGGHAVNIVGYDAKTLTCITWGKPQAMTWAFWHRYCDEAYACLSRMWASSQHPAVDWLTLVKDLGALGTLDPHR